MTKKTVWYARSGDIARMGPYDSQVKAAKAIKLVKQVRSNAEFHDNAFIWPEEVNDNG